MKTMENRDSYSTVVYHPHVVACSGWLDLNEKTLCKKPTAHTLKILPLYSNLSFECLVYWLKNHTCHQWPKPNISPERTSKPRGMKCHPASRSGIIGSQNSIPFIWVSAFKNCWYVWVRCPTVISQWLIVGLGWWFGFLGPHYERDRYLLKGKFRIPNHQPKPTIND